MLALSRINEKLRNENRAVAVGLTIAVDRFCASPTPADLQDISDIIRDGVRSTEEQLQWLDGIAKRRKGRFARLSGGPHVSEHYELIKERRLLLEQRKRMLRQIADGLAWHLMGRNQRIVSTLYAKRTNTVSSGVGLLGVLMVQDALQKSGKYYALECDLSRCSGTGDLMIVPVDRIGTEPLVAELKTTGENRIGAELGVGIGSVHSNAPEHKQMLEEVTAILDAEPWEAPPENKKATRQFAELEDRTRRLFERNRSGAQVLRRPKSPHWRTMADVINRAHADGYCFDLAEQGVAKWAVRALPGDDFEKNLLEVFKRMSGTFAIAEDNPHSHSSNVDLATKDDLSAFVAPLVLWQLPVGQRAALLVGEMVTGNLRESDLLEKKLRAKGIDLVHTPGGVVLRKGDDERVIHQHEWFHLDASMALTGISIDDVATTIAEGFDVDETDVGAVAPDEAEKAWAEVAGRRLEEIETGKVEPIPGEEIIRAAIEESK